MDKNIGTTINRRVNSMSDIILRSVEQRNASERLQREIKKRGSSFTGREIAHKAATNAILKDRFPQA